MNLLEKYGWNAFFEGYHTGNNTGNDFHIGRVISVQGFKYHVMTETGEIEAELAGRLLYGSDNEQLPRVGDWVYFLRYDDLGYIADVFPRINALSRKNPGNRTERQIIASNIDFAIVVQGLDREFNLMRLDRYIVQIVACGITPVIVLNKADLADDLQLYDKEISRLGRDYKVHFCSVTLGSGLDELFNQVLQPGMTYVLVGSSGVGKSSILNAMMEELHRKTGAVSHSTRKGRHVTTTRDLFLLPNGSLIIDTPGMREFGIALESEITSSGLFPAIDRLSGNCRFSNCRHLSESGCAVHLALAEGKLDQKIYDSYVKMVREQEHFSIRIEDRKRLGKQFGKMVKEAKEYRRRFKY